jgi:glycosyltransferase involved in cell wall biosynthesis
MGAGWAIAEGAARLHHDVVLITQPRHRSAIERALRDDPELDVRLNPVYLGLPVRFMDLWERHGRLGGLQLYYLAWQVLLLKRARALHRVHPFDVGHHATMSTDWVPTGLAFVDDLPLVWGPVGGAEQVPEACRAFLGRRGRITERVRSLTAAPMRSLLAARAARRCALLVAQNEEEATWLRRIGPPVVVRPNVFLDDNDFLRPDASSPRVDPGTGPSQGSSHLAVFAGRLLAWKGVAIALATLRRPEMADWRLIVFGDGPEHRRLQAMVSAWGLEDRVSLLGRRPRAEVLEALTTADAFLFPSMREAAGWVVGEALAAGCPVVCLNTGGPPQLLRGTGHAVAPGPDLLEGLSRALRECVGAPRTIVRWDRSSVGHLLTQWYSVATGGPIGQLDQAMSRG